MLALSKGHAFSKCRCGDENPSSVGGNQTKIGLMQRYKRGIDYELIDHLFTEA